MKSNEISLYELYENSVQEPEAEILFWIKSFQEHFAKEPLSMREDFCATFKNSCEWVKQSKNHSALAVDIDEVPLEYGRRVHFPKLKAHQKERLTVLKSDVLKVKKPQVDLVTVSNFSICFFKERKSLLRYLKSVFESIKPQGAVCIDLLGGTEVEDQDYEEREFCIEGTKKKYTYFWEQEFFNPITRETQFYIHYKGKGQKKIEKAFSYDWRLWTLPELRDLLKDAGFKDVSVYWEGDDGDGNGNGEFEQQKVAENCESWIAYVLGVKK